MTGQARATIVGDRVELCADGSTLLKVRHALCNVLSAEELIYRDKTTLAFPLRYSVQASDAIARFNFQLSCDLRREMERAKAQYENHLSARTQVRTIQEEGLALTGSAHWDGLLKPRQGIVANCMAADGLLGLCVFDEQGTGKTLSAIAAFDLMRGRGVVKTLLVVGQKTFLGSWEEEFGRFLPGKYRILLVHGDRASRFRSLYAASDVYLINYESVADLLTPLKSLAAENSAMLVVDESYFVKNPDAKRSVAVRALRSSCQKGFSLCGTPAPNNPVDIIHQFDIADMGFTFVGFRPSGADALDRADILNRIEERGVYLRKPKSEVLPELPKKRFRVLELEMGGRQLLLYEKARRELVLFLRGLDNSVFHRSLLCYFQRRAALLQICVSPRMIDKLYDEIPVKYSALDGIVDSVVKQEGKKLVIWSVYTRTLDDMEQRFRHLGLVRIDGTVTSGQRRTEMVRAFQEDAEVRVFLGNPAAAGAGITLHAASECVYMSFSNQAAHYLQSLDRIHRLGQVARSVRYTFLVCKGSIEESELRRLSEKEAAQQDLLGDPTPTGLTLERALDELKE